MRIKRDKQQSQPPWYIRPTVFKIVGFLARVLINLFDL